MKRGTDHSATQLAVVALLPEHADSTALEAAVRACGGRWIRPEPPELTSLELARPVPIILYDRELPGRWQRAVSFLAGLPGHSDVILLSSVDDQYLWEEVVRQGGYDVLPKSAKTEDMIRLLRAAYSHWRNVRHPGDGPEARGPR